MSTVETPFRPRWKSKTDRKRFRRHVRAALGTSLEAAPEVSHALAATQWLNLLLRDASGGRIRLAVQIDGDDPVTPETAYRRVEEINRKWPRPPGGR